MGTRGFPEVDWSVPPGKFMSTRLHKSDKYLPSKNKVKISMVLNDSGQTKEPQFPRLQEWGEGLPFFSSGGINKAVCI